MKIELQYMLMLLACKLLRILIRWMELQFSLGSSDTDKDIMYAKIIVGKIEDHALGRLSGMGGFS